MIVSEKIFQTKESVEIHQNQYFVIMMPSQALFVLHAAPGPFMGDIWSVILF